VIDSWVSDSAETGVILPEPVCLIDSWASDSAETGVILPESVCL
jgi:hypothetical protein